MVCTECDSSYYGITCLNPCPSHCKNGDCDTKDGRCRSGCHTEYYGPFCCPENMTGFNCTQKCPEHCKACDVDGMCTECYSGYYGDYCSQACPLRCKYDVCKISDGTCTSGCNNKYSGKYCCFDENGSDACSKVNTSCPINCKSCNHGTCVECIAGFFKHNCSKRCSDNCYDDACSISTGHCSSGCKIGYFGDMCMVQCSKQCVDDDCIWKTGICSRGCVDGYQMDNASCVLRKGLTLNLFTSICSSVLRVML